MTKDAGLKCAACKDPITNGDDYYYVPTPKGLVLVHHECMEGKSKDLREREGANEDPPPEAS